MADEEHTNPTCPCEVEDEDMTQAGALHVELNHLWNDLWWALRGGAALDSSRVENLTWRIQLLSRPNGPLHWDHITVSLLRDGTYERVHAGVEYTPIDWDRVALTEASIEARTAGYLR